MRDSGSGIAPEDLPRIFERGGGIGIESELGKGTEVTGSLPR